MILNRVTAFVPRASRHERLWLFGEEPDDALLYCATGFTSLQARRDRVSIDDLRAHLEVNGGFLAQATYAGLDLKWFRSSTYQPPTSVLVIKAPHAAEWQSPSGVDVGWREHVIVPVDEEARQRLVALTSALGDLPADQEAMSLYSLGRPSIDWRLSRIEDQLAELHQKISGPGSAVSARTGEPEPGEPRRRADRLRRWAERLLSRWVIGPAAALIVMGAAGWTYWVVTTQPGSQSQSTSQGPAPAAKSESSVAQPATPAASTPVTSSPPPPASSTIPRDKAERAIADLIAQLVETAKSSQDPAIRRISATHFNDIVSSVDELITSDRLLPAALKLRFLRYVPEFDADPLLTAPKINRALIDMLVKRAGLDRNRVLTWGADLQTGPMLAHLACRSAADPRIAGISSEGVTALFAAKPCADIEAQDAIAGLKVLVGFVRERSRQTPRPGG